jgi:hypothetical protein
VPRQPTAAARPGLGSVGHGANSNPGQR